MVLPTLALDASDPVSPPSPTSPPSVLTPSFTPLPASWPPRKTSLALAEVVHTLGLTARRVELHPILRGRVVAMLAFLRFYTTLSLELNWTEASELAAVGHCPGDQAASPECWEVLHRYGYREVFSSRGRDGAVGT